MFIQPYQRDELRFAYCYRVYLRWRTHRACPCPPLATLDHSVLDDIGSSFAIRVLESASDQTDLLTLVSLKPGEAISGCASKLKGQVSKWLREALQLAQPADLLSRGYFACTVGKSTAATVEQYLSQQSEHHGYANRVHPPIYVERYEISAQDETRIRPKHAVVHAQFHLVMAARWRRSVFGSEAGRAVTAEWRRLQSQWKVAFVKVSFVPDHVHVALRAHPSVAPADLVVALMNAAQRLVFEEFADSLIQAEVDRLWQPSAYIGAYGELASPQIAKYIRMWEGEAGPLATVQIQGTSPVDLEFGGEQ